MITFNKKAFSYIYDNGIIEESAYPFTSDLTQVQGKCRFKNGQLDGKPYKGTIWKLKKFIWVDQGDDNALMQVLDKYGPVAVSLNTNMYIN